MSEEQAKRREDERNTRETTTAYIEMKWVQQIPALFSLSPCFSTFFRNCFRQDVENMKIVWDCSFLMVPNTHSQDFH